MGLRNQKGNVLVEFAIVAPLLVLLITGAIEFGLLFYNKQVLANASREGARQMITLANRDDITDADVRQFVMDYCNGQDGSSYRLINLMGSDALASEDIVFGTDGPDDISVTVSFPYNFLFGGIIGFDSITLSTQTIMRKEPVPPS